MEALVENLREYLLDLEQFNDLNLGQETLPPELMKGAVQDGINEYDVTLPLSTTSELELEASITGPKWYLVKQLAACNALDRVIVVEIRNRNPVNDAGFQVDEHDKAPDWKALVLDWRRRLLATPGGQIVSYKRSLELRGFQAQTVSMYEPS